MNKMSWYNYTWNPVWGCLDKCPYCFAREIAKRFAKQIVERQFKNYVIDETISIYDIQKWKDEMEERLIYFLPVWLPENYKKPFPKKPSRILVNSTGDIYFWQREWMQAVLEKIEKYPQHIFLFLTKFPVVYEEYEFPQNCWLGVTFTGGHGEESRLEEFGYVRKVRNRNLFFFLLEPFLDNYLFENYLLDIEWVIVGAQTNPYQFRNYKTYKKVRN